MKRFAAVLFAVVMVAVLSHRAEAQWATRVYHPVWVAPAAGCSTSPRSGSSAPSGLHSPSTHSRWHCGQDAPGWSLRHVVVPELLW